MQIPDDYPINIWTHGSITECSGFSIRFFVPGIVKAQQRFKFTKKGVRYTPKQTRTHQSLVRDAFDGVDVTLPSWCTLPYSGPIQICVTTLIQAPKSRPKWFHEKLNQLGVLPALTRPDIDNYLKLVMDALNGIVWYDDKYVFSGHQTKMYAQFPGHVVNIRFFPHIDADQIINWSALINPEYNLPIVETDLE